MATAQSTGKTRSTRNRPADRRPKVKPQASASPNPCKPPARLAGAEVNDEREGDLHDLIEDERGRLQTAEAVLACLHFALTYDDYFQPNEAPSYPDVAQVAMGLIRTAVTRLDSLYVGQKIEAALAAATSQVDD